MRPRRKSRCKYRESNERLSNVVAASSNMWDEESPPTAKATLKYLKDCAQNIHFSSILKPKNKTPAPLVEIENSGDSDLDQTTAPSRPPMDKRKAAPCTSTDLGRNAVRTFVREDFSSDDAELFTCQRPPHQPLHRT